MTYYDSFLEEVEAVMRLVCPNHVETAMKRLKRVFEEYGVDWKLKELGS